MTSLRPPRCPISGETEARLAFAYEAPPSGEVGFRRDDAASYYREVWQFARSNHFVSCHAMQVATSYRNDYVNASYGDAAGLASAFKRILSLPPERSDNVGRFAHIKAFADTWFQERQTIALADIGAGLGVFPHAVRQAGWQCLAVDPDPRAVEHIRTTVGVPAVCGDFMDVAGEIGRFDIVTFNKVLEHVEDPIAMLRHAQQCLAAGGFVYVEVPDGEMAALEGPGREEFFVEHLHVFSFASLVMMANVAGYSPINVERLREPSSKFTLRAFLVPEAAQSF